MPLSTVIIREAPFSYSLGIGLYSVHSRVRIDWELTKNTSAPIAPMPSLEQLHLSRHQHHNRHRQQFSYLSSIAVLISVTAFSISYSKYGSCMTMSSICKNSFASSGSVIPLETSIFAWTDGIPRLFHQYIVQFVHPAVQLSIFSLILSNSFTSLHSL